MMLVNLFPNGLRSVGGSCIGVWLLRRRLHFLPTVFVAVMLRSGGRRLHGFMLMITACVGRLHFIPTVFVAVLFCAGGRGRCSFFAKLRMAYLTTGAGNPTSKA